MQLFENQSAFETYEVKVIAFTIDSPAKLRKFVKRHRIDYPILGGTNGNVADTFGIGNEQISRGYFAYGAPHPGAILPVRDGTVLRKLYQQAYQNRPTFAAVSTTVREASSTLPNMAEVSGVRNEWKATTASEQRN